MVRTQIQFEDAQLEALREQAANEKVSISELVRRAVGSLARRSSVEVSETERRRRAIATAGRFASGLSDVAENHDEHLDEAYRS